jgi:hypothetical protein
MNFFFYGSLMDRELLSLVIGRTTDELRMEAATIHDFVCRRALNESFPILVPDPGGRVEGKFVTGLTAADIARLKFYEASDYEDSEYVLTALSVECRGELLPAQVFFPTVHIAADETFWNFETWAAAERPLFMAMAEERMSRYGSISTAENNALWPQMKAEVERRFRSRQRSGTPS